MGLEHSNPPSVAVIGAAKEQRALVGQLLQLSLHELSIYGDGDDVGPDGRYEYQYLDDYWIDRERFPFVIRCDGVVAGFAFVRAGTPHQMAEFFILRRYRRRGIATRAARELFRTFPGEWDVHELNGNESATTFWRSAIPYPFVEVHDKDGIAQRFDTFA